MKKNQFYFSLMLLSLLLLHIMSSQAETLADSPLKEAIEAQIEANGQVELDLFVMPYCTYALAAEQRLIPIVQAYSDQVTLKLHFIAHQKEDGTFSSMHGQMEVEEAMRQSVIQEHCPDQFLDYLLLRTQNPEETAWKKISEQLQIDFTYLSCLYDYEMLFAQNIQRSQKEEIYASPTLLINQQKYEGTFQTSEDVEMDGEHLALQCDGVDNGTPCEGASTCQEFQCIFGECVAVGPPFPDGTTCTVDNPDLCFNYVCLAGTCSAVDPIECPPGMECVDGVCTIMETFAISSSFQRTDEDLPNYVAAVGRFFGHRSLDNIYAPNQNYRTSRRANNHKKYYDLFTALYDANGHLLWAETAGSLDGNARGHDVQMDRQNNIITAGFIEGKTDFDSGAIIELADKQRGLLLSKHDINGRLLWTQTAKGNQDNGAYALAINEQDEILITGHINGNTTFGTTILSSKNKADGNDVFLAKYAENGDLLWVKLVAWGKGNDVGMNMDLDEAGNIILIGSFNEDLNFENNTVLQAVDQTDAFIAKFTPEGDLIWAKAIGGMGVEGNTSKSLSLVVDHQNDIIVGGDFNHSIRFDATTTFNSTGDADAFVAKYNADGNFLWAKHGKGNTDATTDRVKSVTVDACNNILVAGEFHAQLNWNEELQLEGIGKQDIFMLKLDEQGHSIWGTVEGGTQNDYSMDIINDQYNRTITAGCFFGRSTIGGVTVDSDYGQADLYIAYHHHPIADDCLNTITGEESSTKLSQQLQLYPNPTTDVLNLDLDLDQSTAVQVSIINVAGQELYRANYSVMSTGHHQLSLPVKDLTSGLYFMQVNTEDAVLVERLLVE